MSNNVALVFNHEFQLSTCTLCYNRKINKYMHEIVKIRLQSTFVFNIREELISKSSITECSGIYLISMGYARKFADVTHLSLRIVLFCIFKR